MNTQRIKKLVLEDDNHGRVRIRPRCSSSPVAGKPNNEGANPTITNRRELSPESVEEED